MNNDCYIDLSMEKTIDQNKLLPGIEYAYNIIYDNPKFEEFAIAMLDYMGEDYRYVKSIYSMLISYLEDNNSNLKLDDYNVVKRFSQEDIKLIYHQFKQKQDEKTRQQEFKDNIDELQFLVKEYRSSAEFKKMLDFVGRFKYLAPYNAMLVGMQKPGATFVLNGKKWSEYNRRPKVNAQKLITLVPFGPIQCMFDFEDTEPINDQISVPKAELMEEWYNTLKKTRGNIDKSKLDLLISNLMVYGIYLDDNFSAANSYGGYIMRYKDKQLNIPINKELTVPHKSCFIISINKNKTDVEKFHTLCHELGHLFCYHLSYDSQKKRNLTTKEKEFEAETVAWLMCKRHDITNPSEEYLAGYAPNNEIPICSVEHIMKAVAEIEKMISGKIYVKESLWYKEDKSFKEAMINEIKKRKKPLQMNLFSQKNNGR